MVAAKVPGGEREQMATRKARKVGAAKSKSSTARTTPKTVKKAPPKEVSIPYEHASDYRQFSPTGTLVRAERNSVVVTFYVDEIMPVRHTAKLRSVKGELATYDVGDVEETPRRLVVASVRIDPEHAASLATLITEKCYSVRPDLLPGAAPLSLNAIEKK